MRGARGVNEEFYVIERRTVSSDTEDSNLEKAAAVNVAGWAAVVATGDARQASELFSGVRGGATTFTAEVDGGKGRREGAGEPLRPLGFASRPIPDAVGQLSEVHRSCDTPYPKPGGLFQQVCTGRFGAKWNVVEGKQHLQAAGHYKKVASVG
ncbi:hypothetical protein RvY_12116 [Ramazzottius varieornatus]|uniref:Uncharacterized protein n=1 Tax=Ramazzottius varieornatus TaxID=947166 RepID=A0A1D1VR15_RAMVA|nr:hypothetical protein RvY_12116 [Ramazzottius varieornatus]